MPRAKHAATLNTPLPARSATDRQTGSPGRPLPRGIVIGLPLGIIGVFAALLLALRPSGPAQPRTVRFGADVRREFAGLAQHADILGSAQAPVRITMFGDLICPICRAFDTQQLPALLPLVRSGKVSLRYRLWSILGPSSRAVAPSALAALRQDRLWTFASLWYANQGDESSAAGWATPRFARSVASGAGLDLPRYTSDVAAARRDGSAKRWLARTMSVALRMKLEGTPSLVIVGPRGQVVLPSPAAQHVPTASDVEQAIRRVSG
jgi:protein-disulfide isomerase